MCISRRQIIIIIIINIAACTAYVSWKSGNTNLFHDLKQYHSLEHPETKKYFFFY